MVALLDSQLAHPIGLSDVCDSLQLNVGALSSIRGASRPSRNGLSHANKVGNAALAEPLFWSVLDLLKENFSRLSQEELPGPGEEHQQILPFSVSGCVPGLPLSDMPAAKVREDGEREVDLARV